MLMAEKKKFHHCSLQVRWCGAQMDLYAKDGGWQGGEALKEEIGRWGSKSKREIKTLQHVVGIFLPRRNISFMSLAELYVPPPPSFSASLHPCLTLPPSTLSRLGFHFGGPSDFLSFDQGAFKVPWWMLMPDSFRSFYSRSLWSASRLLSTGCLSWENVNPRLTDTCEKNTAESETEKEERRKKRYSIVTWKKGT